MKAIAPDANTSWHLRVTDEEYGALSQVALKRIASLSVNKPHNGKSGFVTWELWGELHLRFAIEVGLYEGLILES